MVPVIYDIQVSHANLGRNFPLFKNNPMDILMHFQLVSSVHSILLVVMFSCN